MCKGYRSITSAEVPGATNIILCSRTRDFRRAVVVNEDHFITLAKPAFRVLYRPKRHAHQVALALCFEERVVLLAFYVDFFLLRSEFRGPVRSRLTILGVEIERIRR